MLQKQERERCHTDTTLTRDNVHVTDTLRTDITLTMCLVHRPDHPVRMHTIQLISIVVTG